jgi:hypothetical protein
MQMYNFNVSFDAQTHEVTIEGVSSEGLQPSFPIHAPQGISLITFTLVGSSGALFPSSPIQWLRQLDDLETCVPTALPPWFVMHWHDDTHFALWDFNSAPEKTSHEFVLSVFRQGQLYSSDDPVIINEPPSTP